MIHAIRCFLCKAGERTDVHILLPLQKEGSYAMGASSEKQLSNQRAIKRREILLLRKRERMKQQRMRRITIIAAGCLILSVILYLVIAGRYRTHFLPRTNINGIAVGGKTVEQAEQLLKESVEDYSLTVKMRGDKEETISGNDISLSYISSNETTNILSSQDRFAWLPAIFGKGNVCTVETGFHFDSDRLKSCLSAFQEFQAENITKPQDAYLVLDQNQAFQIKAEVRGNQPDSEIVFQEAELAVQHGEHELDLTLIDGAYVSPAISEKTESLVEQRDLLNDFLSTSITIRWKDGSTTLLDRDKLLSWISTDDTGSYELIKTDIYEKAWLLMSEAGKKYDDVKTTLDFNSTSEGVVRLKCDPYGYKIDVEKGMDDIVDALYSHTSGEIKPENMLPETMDPTFGGTYCEIDITGQHLWYYEEGSLVLDTDCVTGLESDSERRTPSGLFYLNNKVENAVLGSNDPSEPYSVTVDCWMPFFESYGMHDARWRDEFGGDLYLYEGTHGCANLPSDVAHSLFNRIEIWTPVIVLRKGDGM